MMYLKGVSMVSKAVMMVLFSSMVFSQESSGLSQRLNAIDAQEEEMLSSFEKIKKEQEIKEEQQTEENITIPPKPSVEEKTLTASQIEPEQRDETAQNETIKTDTEEKATPDTQIIQKTEETIPQPIPSKPTAVKSKKHSTKKVKTKKHTKKTAKKSVKKKKPLAAKTEPVKPASAVIIPSPEPTAKKRTALEHLESVLNPK